MQTKNKLVANYRGIDSFYGFDGLALQAVQFFRCGLQVGVGGFGIHVAQGFAAGFVLVHLIGDFQFGACWHVHSPLWSVTVWGLVSSSRLVASIADWGKKMQRCSIYKIMSILHLKLLILHLKLSILHLKMQNLHIFNFFAKLQTFATSVT